MDNSLLKKAYNPDVLSCLANLSNDEVFTSPQVANKMLDMLPKELWTNPDAKFLDPACKSGVFLREIAKRLLEGLAEKIPDLQKRIDHIFHNQLYGIAITELTSLLSRRSVYCSKYPNCKYSVSHFDTQIGNIFFTKTKHTWNGDKCIYCGASKKELDRGEEYETHAYQFIHNAIPEEIKKMKFDVIISNPPYQLNVGNNGGNSSKSKAIYHYFIDKAMKLKPHFLIMITPSRWMTRSTEGISDDWIDQMLEDKRIKKVHDFIDASICFPGVSIPGGVNFFLWDREYHGKCDYFIHSNNNEIISNYDFLDSRNAGIVIRDVRAIEIINKIEKKYPNYVNTEEKNFSSLVSPKDFFTNKKVLTSSWKDFQNSCSDICNIKYYVNKNIHKISFGWISQGIIPKNKKSITIRKVFIPAANGSMDLVLGKPFFGESGSVCSQTYLVIGYDPIKHNFTKEQCENIISYIKTRFFRYLVSVKKKTQNGPRGVYQFVPLQDFTSNSDIDWTKSVDEIDAQLYAKYNLTHEEIAFIESMIKPMDIGGGTSDAE